MLVPFTIMGPKKKIIQMLTTNGKPTRTLINVLLMPQVSQVTRTKFLLIGVQDLQISDDPNVVISLRQAKSTIQAASALPELLT